MGIFNGAFLQFQKQKKYKWKSGKVHRRNRSHNVNRICLQFNNKVHSKSMLTSLALFILDNCQMHSILNKYRQLTDINHHYTHFPFLVILTLSKKINKDFFSPWTAEIIIFIHIENHMDKPRYLKMYACNSNNECLILSLIMM